MGIARKIIRLITSADKIINLLGEYSPEGNYIIGEKSIVAGNAIIENFADKSRMRFGKRSVINKYSYIKNEANGQLVAGSDFRTGFGTNILTYGGNIRIGDGVCINNYSIIYGHGGVSIGNDTQIAAHCVVIPANHRYSDIVKPIRLQGERRKGIEIGNNVWIGANCVILDGVHIGDGAVIGAGSVVSSDIPSDAVAFGVPARVHKYRYQVDSISDITFDIVEYIYQKEKTVQSSIIDRVLQFDGSGVDFLTEQERSFPGKKEFMSSGYYNTMLKRYIFAGAYFCKGKRILDSCCGCGWGTYILSQYAESIQAFDLESKAIDFCRRTWRSDNIEWIVSDALSMREIGDDFDVALAMETIEHFSRDKGEEYISKLSERIKKGGYIVGTSAFPETRSEADEIRSTNPSHLYVHTEEEMNNILRKYFTEFTIINNWMFIAKR